MSLSEMVLVGLENDLRLRREDDGDSDDEKGLLVSTEISL